jgi:acyl dehydratase
LSTDTTPSFRTDLIGSWSEPSEVEVTREQIVAYAQATNDDVPQHAVGDLAPPVFAVVPSWDACKGAGATIVPPELILRVVHGEQDMHFHRPIEPGMTLVSRGVGKGVHARSSGVTVAGFVETRTTDGELVVEQYMTTFVRGAQLPESLGEAAPGHAFPAALRDQAPLAEVTQGYDADQTYRYAEASGDFMRIHLEPEAAKQAGLPGIIIHGLCTMAFTSRAVIQTVCPEDPARLKRLAVRFSSIALPEQSITTRLWEAGANGDRAAYAYETTSDAGAVVIKDGLAEVAR